MTFAIPFSAGAPSLRSLRHLLTTFVVVGAIINVAQFQELDDRASARYSALHLYETPDLIEIARKASSNFRESYGSAIALRAVYQGATIIAPEGERALHPGFSLAVLSVGRARKVERGGAFAVEGFDFRPYIVVSGKAGRKSRAYAVAAAEPSSGRFVFVRRGKRDVLIDEALLTGDNRSGRDGRP